MIRVYPYSCGMSSYPDQQPLQATLGAGQPDPAGAYGMTAHAASRAMRDCLALPFEIARERYAFAVQAGLIERSLLASARYDQAVTAMEHLALGPWARRI